MVSLVVGVTCIVVGVFLLGLGTLNEILGEDDDERSE